MSSIPVDPVDPVEPAGTAAPAPSDTASQTADSDVGNGDPPKPA